MKNLRQRPKGDFNWEAQWQELYLITEQWQSDLQFYKEDLGFLSRLIDKYFVSLIDKNNLDDLREITKGISQEIKDCDSLIEKAAKHLSHLAELIDNPYKYDSHEFRKEHEKLEDEIIDFVKRFRNNKKEIFKSTEKVIGRSVTKKLTP